MTDPTQLHRLKDLPVELITPDGQPAPSDVTYDGSYWAPPLPETEFDVPARYATDTVLLEHCEVCSIDKASWILEFRPAPPGADWGIAGTIGGCDTCHDLFETQEWEQAARRVGDTAWMLDNLDAMRQTYRGSRRLPSQ